MAQFIVQLINQSYFWDTFYVLIHQKLGKKCAKTFGCCEAPPSFSMQNSKIVGEQKLPQNFEIGLETVATPGELKF